MQLLTISLDRLSVSPANMRAGNKPPDYSAILPSVRARGVLTPLLVRSNGTPNTYEIIAGSRRFHAALHVRDEGGGLDALPCAVMEAGDDAAAIEASIIENVARLDPDEVAQWEAFTKLVKAGRGAEDIAATFGIPAKQVARVLALGNLLPAIRTLYRRGEIDPATVRPLTLASRAKQREWIALWRDPDARAPLGGNVKHWLFGGQSVSTKVALFPLESYPGEIVSDLFGDERYFSDSDAFWACQMAAVEERKAAYLADGWTRVNVLERGDYFERWKHEKITKAKGGAVYIAISGTGEVECHEGWLSSREAKRGEDAGDTSTKPTRPELSAPLKNYLDLHRHAGVRTALLDHPAVALRLMVAHAIRGSGLWHVKPEPQHSHSEAIAESIETCASTTTFETRLRAAQAILAFNPEAVTIVGSIGLPSLLDIFRRLGELPDEDVLNIMAFVMSETLEAWTATVEALGVHLSVDLRALWAPDNVFFDLLRDRRVVQALLAEVGGETTATGNAAATLKVQKSIIADCLAGDSGRAKVEGWLPRWLQFPSGFYLGHVREGEPAEKT